MIRLIRKVRVAPGKQQEAIQWAEELSEYNKPKYGDRIETKVFFEIFGELSVMCWMVDSKDLATLESGFKEMQSDPGYQERVRAALGNIFMPDVFDKVYESID